MRRPSVANEMVADRRRRDLAHSAAERMARALALGRRDVALYAASAGLSASDARRAVERRRQARRRPSRVVDALLA